MAAETETIEEAQALVTELVGPGNWEVALRLGALILLALPACFILSTIVGKVARKRLGEHLGLLIQKAILYGGLVAVFISVLVELGFNLGALLGAAGIASIAIGFAAQTSLSNIISGVFLYGEKPFVVGDTIQVGNTLGVVLSIDLMSVKLRQFDNQFVRIPNETMIKTQVNTLTKFPIRRADIEVGVSYDSDIDHVIEALTAAADENPLALDDPSPVIVFKGFGDSSLNFMIGAWCEKTQFLLLKNSLMKDIKRKFDEEGIEIPFPQRVVHMMKPEKKDELADS